MAIPTTAQPGSITPFVATLQMTDRFGNPTTDQMQYQERMRNYIVGSGRLIPCSASGTNDILLTVNQTSPTIEKYVFGDVFPFWAAANSTGTVTVAVAIPARQGQQALTMSRLPAYSASGVALGGGDIVQDAVYKALFVPTFNGGNGGFLVSLF